MYSVIEKYTRALKKFRDDGISVPVLPSEMRQLISEFLALKEHCAALESREVCTVAHENVETCGYCQRDALSKDAARYRWLRANNSLDAKFCISIEDDDDPSVAYSGHSPIELDGIIDAVMERR